MWAVDVNERALDLVRRNAARLGLTNVNAVLPDDVPDDVRFTTIWSNPPIRVGKHELHDMLRAWLPRLDDDATAWLVVAKQPRRRLAAALDQPTPSDLDVVRAATTRASACCGAHARCPGLTRRSRSPRV